MIKKGTYVTLRCVVLNVGERSPNLPDDTKKVPLVMWVKGRLTEDAQLNQAATVVTRTGRLQEGVLTEVEPCYTHNYGKFIPELLTIDEQLNAEREEFDNE